jgi:hypothetical protein
MTWKQAALKARQALEEGKVAVYLPLGMPYTRVLNYRAIKPASFIFQSPEQRAAILRQVQKFEERTGCGLEVLTLRRSYQGRRQGSIRGLAEDLYELIQSGGRDVTKRFNLTRSFDALEQNSEARLQTIRIAKDEARTELFEQIAEPTGPTGFIIRANNLFWLK